MDDVELDGTELTWSTCYKFRDIMLKAKQETGELEDVRDKSKLVLDCDIYTISYLSELKEN
jgi:hypothetical protein